MTFDYYISTTGSDNNPGTLASPWSINAINSQQSVYAGKSVGIVAGIYDVMTILGISSYPGSWPNPLLTIAGGTSSSPTYIASCNSSGIYSPVSAGVSWAAINGQATSSNDSPQNQPIIGTIGDGAGGGAAGAGYITVDGLEIYNGYAFMMLFGSTSGTGPTPRISNISVQNCYIHDLTNNQDSANPSGIAMYGCDDSTIQNNYLTNLYDNYARAEGIQWWWSINCVTQYNSVVGTSTGDMAGGITHKNANNNNNTIQYNYIYMPYPQTAGGQSTAIGGDCDGGTGTYFQINNNVVIADNPVYNGIIEGNASSTYNQYWFNNTFLGVPADSDFCFWRIGGAATISFYNNIIQRTTAGSTRGDVDVNANQPYLWDYNCYPSSPELGLSASGSVNGYPTQYTNLASWAAALPSACIGEDAHSVLVSSSGYGGSTALFVGGSPTLPAQAYELVAGSPCSGKGSTNGTTSGNATDMGAWGNGATQIGCNFVPA